MKEISFGNGRKALSFGNQKINLHQRGKELDQAAKNPIPGSADLCFITGLNMGEVLSHLAECDIEVLAGPAHWNLYTSGILTVTCWRYRPNRFTFSAAEQLGLPAQISASQNRI